MGDAILPPRYGGYRPKPDGRKPLADPPKPPTGSGAASRRYSSGSTEGADRA